MPGQTPTTFFTSTTAWGHSCWTLTMGSLAFCSVSGTRAKTFPWRLAQISLHTSWRLNWHLKSTSILRFHYQFLLLLSYFYISTPQSPVWHLSPCASLPYRNIWSLYTQRSHIWSCRGSRKGLLTLSSSLPSGCCLPGGTSWPGRKMKALGRLCWIGQTLPQLFFLFIVGAQPDFAKFYNHSQPFDMCF